MCLRRAATLPTCLKTRVSFSPSPSICDTSRVVPSVFETGQAIDEDVNDLLAVLLHQVVDVSENTALCVCQRHDETDGSDQMGESEAMGQRIVSQARQAKQRRHLP